MKMKLGKKGFTIQDLVPIAIAFVVISIVIGMGATILGEIRDTQTSGTASYNASTFGLDAMQELGSWLPILALIVIAAIIIGVIILYFRFR